MILGLDVWSGYGKIDYEKVAAAGIQFVIVKCTEGNEPRRNDRMFAANVRGARDAGLAVGAYHFAYPLPYGEGLPVGRSPAEQAERAYEVSGQLGARVGDLPPAIDAEWPEPGEWAGKWKVSPAMISAWLFAYVERARELWGRTPILYTYPSWWRTLAANADVSWARECPLWIASYREANRKEWEPKPESQPLVVPPWDGDWALWQFAADGSPVTVDGVPACPIDRNVCRDTPTFRKLLGLADEPVLDSAIVHPRVPLGRPSLDGEE